MTILSYIVTSGHIDQDAMNRILQAPKHEWCAAVFLAAQDVIGKSYFLETTTPLWGRALYPELRYWAGLMTGRSVPESPPKFPTWLCVINIFSIGYLAWLLVVNTKQTLILIAFFFALTLVVVLVQRGPRCFRGIRQTRRYTAYEQHM
jgi:hypothetical protein